MGESGAAHHPRWLIEYRHQPMGSRRQHLAMAQVRTWGWQRLQQWLPFVQLNHVHGGRCCERRDMHGDELPNCLVDCAARTDRAQ
jgi:hypothetical protein